MEEEAMEESVEQISPENTEQSEQSQEYSEENVEENTEEIMEEDLEEIEVPVAVKFPCRWPECDVAEFSTELDMGLHVLATHLNLLQHGHFTLTRGLHGPPAPTPAPETPVSSPIPYTVTIRHRKRPLNGGNQSVDVSNSQGDVKMSDVAVRVIRRLMTPSREGRLFQTKHFCLLCQRNFSSPCKMNHDPAEVALVDEWKRSYGHLEPKKKAMLTQMRDLRDRFLREETNPRDIVKNEPEPQSPEDTQDTEEPEEPEPHASEDTQRIEELESDEPEIILIKRVSRIRRNDRNPETFPKSSKENKLSTLCTSIINRIRARGYGFRYQGTLDFCVICLSIRECEVEHTEKERELSDTWKRHYGNGRITAESLIDQLETFKNRYLRCQN